MLDSAQLARYAHDGYLVVEDLLTPAEVDAFVDYAKPGVAAKFGLQGHRGDPQWRYLANHPRVAGTAQQMLGGPARIVQTMYMNKPPAGGKGIALHQDTHYLPSEPNTLMACWVALSDTGDFNGGLCVVPGSHKGGLLSTHQNQGDSNHDSFEHEYEMRDRNGKAWKQKMHRFEIDNLDPKSIVYLNVPKGAGVFFTGLTIHGSYANNSPDRPRRAFATHYIKEGTWLLRCDVQDAVLVQL